MNRELPFGDSSAARGQFADHPVGLQRVRVPGLGPALVDAGANGARVDMLAIFVEERQLATGLVKATPQPRALNSGRRVTPRIEHHKVHAQLLPIRMLNPFSPTRRVA